MGFSTQDRVPSGLSDKAADTWRKSSRSYSSGGCVEVTSLRGKHIGLRDSRDPRGPVLRFAAAEWAAFLANVRDGAFD
jgi:hypothetical protein